MYEYAIKVLRIVDGDTLEASVSLGFHVHKTETLRFAGINTPELTSSIPEERAKANQAKDYATKALLDPNNVADAKVKTEKPYAQDKYGRWLGTVFYRHKTDAAGVWKNLNQELLAAGFAKPYMT